MTGFLIYICVAIFPFLLWFGELFSYSINRQIFDIFLGLSVLSSMCFGLGFKNSPEKLSLEGLLFLNVLLIYALILVFSGFLSPDAYWYNLFMELKPIYYLVCTFWLYSIRTGKEIRYFLNAASFLSCFILIDFIIKFIEIKSVDSVL